MDAAKHRFDKEKKMSELESWKNSTPGRVVLKKYNQKGELASEMIGAGKVFHISPKERRINQEIAASPKQDMFQNGYLTPVRLIESEEDTAEIASNPNLMADSDLHDMFKGNWRAFDAKLNEISNLTTLNRLLEVAREVDATVRQVETIQARIDEVNPPPEERESNDPVSGMRTISTR